MHLGSVILRRFRSCEQTEVKLRPDLSVLVGENNGGKSNIIDALRLLTAPLNGRRELYAEDDDIRRGSAERTFEVEGHFAGLSETLKGLLISAVPDPNEDRAVIGMRYQMKNPPLQRGRVSFWAGRFDTAEPEPGSLDLVRHVFLPPLRDARQALGSASGIRILTLLEHFLEQNEEVAFLDHVRRDQAPHRVVTAVNTEIGSALDSLTQGVRRQSASLDFTTETVADVARALRFRLADAGVPVEDIRSSGLGYANLLYIATVVVELARSREADLTLFLVEEPEAHLHPQLQMLVLDYLLGAAKKSMAAELQPGQPEGQIQVVVTTHSPNLTAWVSPEHLVVVRSPREEGEAPARKRTVAIPVANLGLSADALRKIRRYLDVTRSAVLFGSRAMLVEGIAEAILIPIFAKHVVLREDTAAFQRFRGAVVVPIDGVDFRPYAEVLLTPFAGETVADRVVVVTDADPQVDGNRAADLQERAVALGSGAKMSVFTNMVTLEHELFLAGNADALKKAFVKLHPRSADDWVAEVDQPNGGADGLLQLFERKRVRKGDFAQHLASLIEGGEPFQVPDYLDRAIRKIAEV